MTVALSPTKVESTSSVGSKTASPSLQICNRCLDGWHKCWPGECACTQCNKPLPKLRKPGPTLRKPKRPTVKVKEPAPQISEDLERYVARQLIEDAGSPRRVSQPEWDAVANRNGWTHMEVAIDLDITYERVRYVRRMSRPVDEHVAPAYRDIAYRAGCHVDQVYKVMRDLVVLRDGRPEDRPENGASFL